MHPFGMAKIYALNPAYCSLAGDWCVHNIDVHFDICIG